jgi:hypothetical protein
MLIIMIVNCWFLHMDASSTIIKEKSFGPTRGGRGGPTGRPICDTADGRVRADAADGRGRPIRRSRGSPSDRGGRADRRVGANAIFGI